MLDHIIITVSDYAASKKFYSSALEPLGYAVIMEFGRAGGFGVDGKPDFWIKEGDAVTPAMNAGGKDNGAPGLRPDYHPNYYGTFVFDPDGNNIEAVCHKAV